MSLATTVASSTSMLEMSFETQQEVLQRTIDTASESLTSRIENSVNTVSDRLGELHP